MDVIHLFKYFNTDQYTSKTLEQIIPYLPSERKNRLVRYNKESDRKNCAIGYLLLTSGLNRIFKIQSPRLSYSDKGKPFLTDYPDIHFNISHCPKGCICGISSSTIGVDIQDIRPFSPEVANRCCSENELELLKKSKKPADEFTKIWTMKESYLKMTGEGITGDLRIIDTTNLKNEILTWTENDCWISISCDKKITRE